MRTGKTLQELATEIERQAESKVDFRAPSTMTRVLLDEEEPVFEVEGQGRYPMRPTFHQQLAQSLAIPKPYYDRMLQEAPALLAGNANHWLQANPTSNLVRTLDGYARARLSSSYRPLDNLELGQAVFPALGEMEVKIRSCELTERRIYIQATTPRVTGEVKVGEPVQAGVTISSSEIGFGRINVETLVYILRCRNGWIGHSVLRKTHLGKREEVEAVEQFYRTDTCEADDKAFFLKVRDSVRGALSDEVFQPQLALMQGATERRIEGHPEKAVEVLAKRLDLREGEKGSVLRHLIDGGDLSAWGVGQAVTRLAHDSEDYDRSVELERMGNTVIELPKTDWRAIAEAA